MNNLIYIQHAKVIYKGQFATGNNNNGPWAALNAKVEFEYQYNDANDQPVSGKMTAVVKFSGNNAVWARDNITAGNPYNNIPDTFLDLWLRTYGDIEVQNKKDGSGTWENINNTLLVEFFKLSEQAETTNA